MGTTPPPGPGNFGWRFEEAMNLFEDQLQNTVRYMNDRVVPHVRKESIAAMRRMAETLGNLAERLEQRVPQAPDTKTEDRRS